MNKKQFKVVVDEYQEYTVEDNGQPVITHLININTQFKNSRIVRLVE